MARFSSRARSKALIRLAGAAVQFLAIQAKSLQELNNSSGVMTSSKWIE